VVDRIIKVNNTNYGIDDYTNNINYNNNDNENASNILILILSLQWIC